MKRNLNLLILIILAMGLFSFLKKEKRTETNQNTTILGMVLLDEPNSMEIDKVMSELKDKWKLKIDGSETSDETSVLDINGYRVAIANIPVPIPTDEVKSAAEYNYFWKNGVEESSRHKGHIILSIMNAGKNPIQENLLFSKVASAVMNNSKSSGMYIGGRTLVLNRDFYQSNVKTMTEEDLPLYIWTYGLRKKRNGNSGFR